MATVGVDYKPLPWQQEFHNCSARFRIVCNGRQTGKTTAAIHELITSPKYGAAIHRNKTYYWVDPTHKFSLKCLEIFQREYPPALRRQLGIKVKRSQDERSLVFEKTGSKIIFFTAQNPDSLVGDAIDGVVINEAGLIENPAIWNQMLRPALGVKKGFAIFVSSPRNKNWFYDIFNEGKKGCEDWQNTWDLRDHTCCEGRHLYHTFQNPTNIYTSMWDAGEIEQARNAPGVTASHVRMEYDAEFLEDSSEVFRSFRNCIAGKLEPPNSEHSYYIGVDIAKSRDWTVVTVLDRHTNHIVHFDRFQGVPWNIIEDRIVATWRKYPGKVIADGTGVGDAICSNLRRKVNNIEVVVFNNKRKIDVIENLISGIEHQDLTFPDIPEMTQELSEFAESVTPHGNRRYEGRTDGHDDCVISLALAYWPLRMKPAQQLTQRQIKMVKRSLRI